MSRAEHVEENLALTAISPMPDTDFRAVFT
jgi:hypothetical protein